MPARTHHPITPYAFLLPSAVVLGVFLLGAAGQVAYYSFTKYTAFSGPDWVGGENYARVLASDRFWRCVLNSAIYLLVTPAIVVLSLLAAMVVESGLRGAAWLKAAFFMPVVTPTIVAAMAWRIVFNEDSGLLNAGLGAIGFGPIRWLTEWPWTLVAPMMVTLWKGFGFYMLVFVAALLAVPRELKEAAAIDGASRWRVFTSVTLPELRPAIALVLVVSSISALKAFEELFVTVRGTPVTHQTAVPLIYRVAFEEGNYGLASAMGVVLFVVILALSLVNLRLSRRAA